MKKYLCILISLCLMGSIISIPSSVAVAATYEDVWEFTAVGTEAVITAYTGAESTVVVPDTVSDGTNTYTVTSIGDGSSNIDPNKVLIDVTLPSTIKKINDKAFNAMDKGGFTVNFPEGLEEIGNQAFYNTNKKGDTLLNIVLPSTLKKIGYGAFYYCSRTKSITFNSVNAPEIVNNNNSREAFWNLSAKPIIYYPENGVGYDDTAFRNEFASTNALPVEGTNALTFVAVNAPATEEPSPTPEPTAEPTAAPAVEETVLADSNLTTSSAAEKSFTAFAKLTNITAADTSEFGIKLVGSNIEAVTEDMAKNGEAYAAAGALDTGAFSVKLINGEGREDYLNAAHMGFIPYIIVGDDIFYGSFVEIR